MSLIAPRLRFWTASSRPDSPSESLPVTGNTSHTTPENRVFFPALDGLRALALIMVFSQHYLNVPWGWTGVNVFFVLSGFLITGILFDTRDDEHRVRNFYVRRTLRIFPLYYGIFLGLLLLAPVFHWHWSLAWLAWPLYVGNALRFLSPASQTVGTVEEHAADAQLTSLRMPHSPLYLGHFWSLCVEEQFYLVWPWIVFFVRSRRALLWICSVTVVLVPLLRVYTQLHAPAWMLQQELLYRATFFQIDSLLLGGLVALLWRGSHRAAVVSAGRWLAWIGLALAAAYLAHTVHSLKFSTYPYPLWKLTWGLAFVNFLSAALILCCVSGSGFFYRLFKFYPLRWIGRISYGAYVWHDILHMLYVHVVGRYLPAGQTQRMAVAVLAFVSTFVLSWLSFRFFETPFLNLKEKWTVRGSPPIPAAS